MTEPDHTVPREAITGIAIGLMMMAVFTCIWATIANAGLQGSDHHIALYGFGALVGVFFASGIVVFKQAKNFEKATSAADIEMRKKSGMWFGIIFGAEGFLIFIAVNLVINLGHPELTIPAIALVVGLHFYPMAKIFKRKVDYYLATWTTLVAIAGIILSLNKIFNEAQSIAFVGVGTAVATSCYGIYMLNYGTKLIKQASS